MKTQGRLRFVSRAALILLDESCSDELFGSFPNGCRFSGQPIPNNRICWALPSCMTRIESPSIRPTTFSTNPACYGLGTNELKKQTHVMLNKGTEGMPTGRFSDCRYITK